MKLSIPLFFVGVSAGFPSPAEDYIEAKLDLNEYLIKHPAATYFARVNGDSMKNIGIHTGDILIVDKSLDANNNSIVVASLNGEFTLKRVRKIGKQMYLVPENDKFKSVKINPEDEFQIFGVVSSVIKQFS